MSLINLSLKHGSTLDEAQRQLQGAVQQVRGLTGPMVERVEWSNGERQVRLEGRGFWLEMWVDAQEVHARGDMPTLGKLFAGPLASGLSQVLRRSFPKQLT